MLVLYYSGDGDSGCTCRPSSNYSSPVFADIIKTCLHLHISMSAQHRAVLGGCANTKEGRKDFTFWNYVLIDAFNRYVYLYASLKHIFEPCWPEVYYIEYSIYYTLYSMYCAWTHSIVVWLSAKPYGFNVRLIYPNLSVWNLFWWVLWHTCGTLIHLLEERKGEILYVAKSQKCRRVSRVETSVGKVGKFLWDEAVPFVGISTDRNLKATPSPERKHGLMCSTDLTMAS